MSNTVKKNPAGVRSAEISNGYPAGRYFDISVQQLDGKSSTTLKVDKDTLKVTTYENNTWTDRYTLATKSDLTALQISGARIGGTRFYTVENNQSEASTKKITVNADTDHLTGLLIIDQNRDIDVYAVGKLCGVKTIIKTSKAGDPTISGNVLTIPLNGWSLATFIGNSFATIS